MVLKLTEDQGVQPLNESAASLGNIVQTSGACNLSRSFIRSYILDVTAGIALTIAVIIQTANLYIAATGAVDVMGTIIVGSNTSIIVAIMNCATCTNAIDILMCNLHNQSLKAVAADNIASTAGMEESAIMALSFLGPS